MGQEGARLAVSYHQQASEHHDRGSYGQAEKLYLRSVGAWEQAYGAEHPGLVRFLNDLASLYLESKDYASAESTCERAARIQRIAPEAVPADDEAKTLLHLGAAHRGLRKYEKSEAAYLRADEIVRRQFGADGPEAMNVWNNLAVLYDDWKMPDKAMAQVRRALALGGASCSRSGALMLTNLAGISSENGLATEAEQVFRAAADCARRTLGAEHPMTADILVRYGAFLRRANRKREAAEIESEAKSVRTAVARADHSRHVVDVKDLQATRRSAR
jgi:tetratricopeptide (TPR) repeat protein